MKKSRFTETQIISILQEADAGMKVRELCRQHGICPATYYSWKSKYGGMSASELKRAKELILKSSDAIRSSGCSSIFGGGNRPVGQERMRSARPVALDLVPAAG